MLEKGCYHRFYSRLFLTLFWNSKDAAIQYSNVVNKAIHALTVTLTKIGQFALMTMLHLT